ncbi:MAG: glutamate formimidoyltransferase [Armatimonadota bacterium]|nr:glutamate formimidoyltransferase [Armatimonadota bacterium]
MTKIFQCIPNFSEGRRSEVVEEIVRRIREAGDVVVADYSADPDHNRCVVTFLGCAEGVRKAALAGARAAVELIDLNRHQGVHPRIGAVDVIPIVPLIGATMQDAVELASVVGSDIAAQLEVPVYFYEESASIPERRSLENIRRGGFEALKGTELVGERAPDVGPPRVHSTAGAVAVGARGPLIAYNINLATNDVEVARRIAARIRALRKTGGGMHGVKAIGLYLASRGIAQVSFNITKPDQVGLWDVYSFVEKEAHDLGVEILESELIGTVREEHLLDALRKAMKFNELTPRRVLENWLPREAGAPAQS